MDGRPSPSRDDAAPTSGNTSPPFSNVRSKLTALALGAFRGPRARALVAACALVGIYALAYPGVARGERAANNWSNVSAVRWGSSPWGGGDAASRTFDGDAPPEWHALSAGAKAALANLLAWEHLSKWEFDLLEVAELTSDPLLLVGWAILGEPTAQEAMRRSLGAGGDVGGASNGGAGGEGDASYRYRFREHLPIDLRRICNFLREVERRYRRDNPYHNNVHAADVIQTVHSLFQMMDETHARRTFDPVAVFSALLAASFHDAGHPGNNNLFEKNAVTPLAIKYNDRSVLENMHSAVGNSLLFGEGRRDEWDVFDGWTRGQRVRAREIMIACVLATDVSLEATLAEEVESLVERARASAEGTNESGDDGGGPRPVLSLLADAMREPASRKSGGAARRRPVGAILGFLLACADVSSVAKSEDLTLFWGNRVFDEFFAQGDREKEMGLPVSPLCDRDAVRKPESQAGFIDHVVRPKFELLGAIIPRVIDEVLPAIVRNKEYWERKKDSG